MYGFVLMLLILDALFLMLVILLQSGKGTGLAAEFGGASSSTDTFLGGRQAATLLTKSSWIGGALFMGLSLLLAILSAQAQGPASVLEGQLRPPASQEAPSPILQQEGQVNPLEPAEGAGQQGEEESGGGSASGPPEGGD